MCSCKYWIVKPPVGKGRQKMFKTEAEAKAYAAANPGSVIKAPKKK